MIPAPEQQHFSDLAKGLKHSDRHRRLKCLQSLFNYPSTTPSLITLISQATQDSDAGIREQAAQWLCLQGVRALDQLGKMLEHRDKYLRRKAATALARCGPQALAMLSKLVARLQDDDPRTVTAVVQALGATGSPSVIPYLIESMRGANIVVCRLAAKALSEFGVQALPALIQELQTHDAFVQSEAAKALGWIGPEAAPAIPDLVRIIETYRRQQQHAQQRSPQYEGSGLYAPQTVESDVTPDQLNAMVHAIEALGKMGNSARETINLLIELTGVVEQQVRHAAEIAIRQIRSELS